MERDNQGPAGPSVYRLCSDQLVSEKPDLVILPLIEISRGSAQGVGEVLDYIASVTGRPLKDHLNDLQILEGNVGTCINLESCRGKLHPAGRRYESMNNQPPDLSGGAHTMWNIGQWKILGGRGQTGDDKDLLYSKARLLLSGRAGKGERPVIEKDFRVIMRMIYQTHFATMVWCLRFVRCVCLQIKINSIGLHLSFC